MKIKHPRLFLHQFVVVEEENDGDIERLWKNGLGEGVWKRPELVLNSVVPEEIHALCSIQT